MRRFRKASATNRVDRHILNNCCDKRCCCQKPEGILGFFSPLNYGGNRKFSRKAIRIIILRCGGSININGEKKSRGRGLRERIETHVRMRYGGERKERGLSLMRGELLGLMVAVGASLQVRWAWSGPSQWDWFLSFDSHLVCWSPSRATAHPRAAPLAAPYEDEHLQRLLCYTNLPEQSMAVFAPGDGLRRFASGGNTNI